MLLRSAILTIVIGLVSANIPVRPTQVPGKSITVQVPVTGKAYFTSPTYPKNYKKDSNFTYTITGPSGSGILFNAVDFELCGIHCTYGCYGDYVSFTEIVNDKVVQLDGQAFCGNSGPPNRLASKTNSVIVQFITGSYGPVYRGFNISATAQARVNTSITVPATGKVYFTSPNYPSANYFINADTVYFFDAPEGSRIEFNSVDFALQDIDIFGGIHDYVTFAQSDTNSKTTLFGGPYFGQNGPKQLRSASNYATVFFASDETFTLRGFKISAQLVG